MMHGFFLTGISIKIKNDTIDVATIEFRQTNLERTKKCKVEHSQERAIEMLIGCHAYVFLGRGNPARNISLKILNDLKNISSIVVTGEGGFYKLTENLREGLVLELQLLSLSLDE